MSERYTRLCKLPENLHLDGAPVLIAAGALLKDNRDDRVLAQLKLRNLRSSPLVACRVTVKAYDPSGAELPGVAGFAYLDLSVSRGADFGTQTPIYLPDNTTRKIDVAVVQAVFQDGEVWQHPFDRWVSVQPHRPLEEFLQDMEMRKQYRIEIGQDSSYVPTMDGDLFLCTCGAVNLKSEGTCSRCGRSAEALISALDFETLTEKKDARLLQEEAKRRKDEEARKEAEKAARQRAEAEEAERERRRAAAEQRQKEQAAKQKKVNLIFGMVLIAVTIAAVLFIQVIIPANKYRKAESMLSAGDYDGAINTFGELGNYKDAADKLIEAKYIKADMFQAEENYYAAIAMFNELGDYKDAKERSLKLWDEVSEGSVVSTGYSHTVGLLNNGSAIAVGNNLYGQCDVSQWTDIAAVSAGYYHTVGLLKDGTVVAAGHNNYGQCDVSEWTDVVAVSAGTSHTVGLRSNGTVVGVGDDEKGQCRVSEWTDIINISAGSHHTVGLKNDGTVVAAGDNSNGQCDVSDWTDIVSISAGSNYTVGLQRNGTVVAAGDIYDSKNDIFNWDDIVSISAGSNHIIGLKSDGTVVAAGDNYYGQCDIFDWTDIVSISAGSNFTVVLQNDGTVMAAGDNDDGQCNVSDWTAIAVPARTFRAIDLNGADTKTEDSGTDQNGSSGSELYTADRMEETSQEEASYILPQSSTQLLTYRDTMGLGERELMLARNEIYARHGRKFLDADVRSYFESQSWYRGTVDSADFNESILSYIEKANIEFIKDEERGLTDTNSYDGDYVIAESSSRRLTDSDLAGFSGRQLELARNEIYARHGRKFLSTDLQEYFYSKSWYLAQYEPEEFSESFLSDIEKYNIEIIKEREQSIR